VAFPGHHADATILRAGAEISTTWNQLTPSLRVTYNAALDHDGHWENVSLAGVLSPIATQGVFVPRLTWDSVTIGTAIQGDYTAKIGWRLAYDANIATKGGAVAHAVTGGLKFGFQ
jgi:hypothetical protein